MIEELKVGDLVRLPMSKEIAEVIFIGKRFATVRRENGEDVRFPSEVLDVVHE